MATMIEPAALHCVDYSPEIHRRSVTRWWESRGGMNPPDDMLGPFAKVAEFRGRPIAFGTIYYAHGQPLALISWMVGEPGVSPFLRGRAVFAVASALVADASVRGVKVVASVSGHPAITKLLERLGLVVVEDGKLLIGSI